LIPLFILPSVSRHQNRFYQSFDQERIEVLPTQEGHRSPYQVDRDRILYTQSFRRLQAKTQVFQTGAYDFYRTRLTHSLEVAQIARSICNYLLHTCDALNAEFHPDPDLVEGVSLAHDIGHPPFGHAGERILNDLMRPYGGFEGNAQSLRLVHRLIFESSDQFSGSNPTRAFLDGILKYKSTWSECIAQQQTTPDNHFLYDDQTSVRDFVHSGLPASKEGYRSSLECQIMDWADDTAYSLNDLSDGYRSGLLTLERVKKWLREQQGSRRFQVSEETINRLLNAFERGNLDSFCGRRIGVFIESIQLTPSNHAWGNHSHRYAWNLTIQPDIKEECRLYKKLAFELVFQSEPLQQMEAKATRMLKEIFALFMDNYLSTSTPHRALKLIPPHWERLLSSENTAQTARGITDYLASLTDGQALRLYRRCFSPEANNLLDLQA
jgi:dGTPase